VHALRSVIATLAACGVLACQSPEALAYPDKPVRVIIPYGPGGATDIIARMVFEKVGRNLNGNFIVESKPGAHGMLAIREVATSTPDGHTMMVGNLTTNSVAPVLHAAVAAVDVRKALIPVTTLAALPNVMVATTVNFPPTTWKEIVAYARANPDKLNYNVAGIGSYGHLDFLALQQREGFTMTAVPLRTGYGGGTADIIRGDVHIALMNAATSMPLIQNGQLKPILVSGDTRLDVLPDTPTASEAGLEGLHPGAWQALFLPAGTPPELVDRIFKAVVAAVNSEEVKGRFAKQHITPRPSDSPAAFAAWLGEDMAQWKKVVDSANLKLQ
jgi:tripartite-type tricarboxylate transporter receptor subunit TctC